MRTDRRTARPTRPFKCGQRTFADSAWWSLPSTIIANRWWSLRVAAPLDTARQVAVKAAAMAARRVLHLVRAADWQVCERAVQAAEAWADQPHEATADAAYAARAAAAEADRAAVRAAAAAERAAQRADLDRLLMETDR